MLAHSILGVDFSETTGEIQYVCVDVATKCIPFGSKHTLSQNVTS